MLGRRKKRQGSNGSVSDLLNTTSASAPEPPPPSNPGPSRFAFNLLERARGAVGFGGKERLRTTSDDGASSRGSKSDLSSSPTGSTKGFFSRGVSTDGGMRASPSSYTLPGSMSMQDIAGPPTKAAGGGAFFRRTPTTSNPQRPGWPATSGLGKSGGQSSPLTSSSSSPMLSLQATEGDVRRRDDRAVYLEGGKKLAAASTNDLGSSLVSPPTPSKTFSRSVEDLSRQPRPYEAPPPVPRLTRRSTDELNREYRASNADAMLLGGTRARNRQTSLYPSSNGLLSTSAPSSHPSSQSSRSASPSPHARSAHNSSSTAAPAVPFPTSASTPNFLPSTSMLPSSSPLKRDSKRDSQTILCQGFLQRKTDYAPPTTHATAHSRSLSHSVSHSHALSSSPALRSAKSDIDLQRGWKPYRVFLKGSKLYLHKLPGDLSATAKLLFPATLLEEPDGAASLEVVAGEEGGKKRQRAFWGTGGTSHPGLLVAEDAKGKGRERVVGGTLEALVHELVFATSFVAKPGEEDVDDRESPYDTFLSTLLLTWPFLPFPTSQSASELDRCSGLAVRTALENGTKDPEASKPATAALAARLEKIVRTTCERYPEDLRRVEKRSDWIAALEELVKQLESLPVDRVGEEDLAGEILERTFEAKSKGKPTQLTEWTSARPAFVRAGSSSSVSTSSSPTKSRKRMTTEPEFVAGLSAGAFLALDPTHFAAQVHHFHLDRLGAITHQSSTSRHILRTAAIVLATDPATKHTTVTSLFSFSPSKPHFLTRTVISTLFPSSPSTPPFSPPNAPSPIDTRVAVLCQWISVGEELRRRGDAAGWAAIAMALCSRAIARLEETWRLVPRDRIDLVRREWVPLLVKIGFADLEEASLGPLAFELSEKGTGVPFLGSILDEAVAALRLATTPMEEHPGAVTLVPLYAIRDKLDQLQGVWTQETPSQLEARPDPEMQLFLQTVSRAPSPSKLQLSAYLAPSLEAEPRLAGSHLNVLFKPRSTTEPSPLIPLLMVEPLPHITLVDRGKIISSAAGGVPRKGSITNLPSVPVPDAAYSSRGPPGRLVRHNSYPPSATPTAEKIGIFARLRKEIANPSDTLLRFADGDIVFRILSSALPTMPAAPVSNERGVLSRTSSWVESRSSRVGAGRGSRTSTGSTTGAALSPLSRTSSRRESSPGSSPSGSHVNLGLQVAGGEEPVDVVVKAGTVEALVDLLVLGIDNLRTPSTDADGESSLAGRRPLRLDADEYRASFFATFRTFTSPLAVLDMLRKRYLAAPNASREYVNLSSAKPFPTWSMAPIVDATELDWEAIAGMRMAVLENVQYWISHHVQDFLDDDDLFASTATFLGFVVTTEHESLLERPQGDGVLEFAEALKARFVRDSLRPVVRSRRSSDEVGSNGGAPLSFDRLSAGELVDKLDRIACAVTKDVTENDLLKYLEVLEGSTLANPVAWYSSRLLAKVDDEELVIADPYAHLQAIGADPTFLRRMPLSLQRGLRVHNVMRRWILCHLVDPDLSLKQRQVRMIRALEMIEICRSRMANVFYGGQTEAQSSVLDPSLASFVERAVMSAVVAPESRLFASAWAGVAVRRGATFPDSLAVLFQSQLVVTDATATLDLAWLQERLVEIATQVDSLSDGISINYNKRRWIYNCVRNALAIRPSQVAPPGDALAQMEKRLAGWGNWGIRILRDVASGEGTKLTKSVKPFCRLVAQHQEKIRRDKLTRDYVSKGIKLEQQSRLQREREVAKAMDKSVSVRTRRMTALFRAVRPVSVATSQPSAPHSPSPSAIQALQEWIPNSKPYLVLALSGVEVHPYDNAQRSFVFELATEDGQRSLFQASSRDEIRTWIANFRRSGTQIAFRRATFLAQTALVEEPEEPVQMRSPSIVQPASKAIFAVPLGDLLRREKSTIPIFVEKAFEVIEERGLQEVGIYRISGENRVTHELKDALDQGADPASIVLDADIHNLTGLVKLYLREMPEPLLPFNLYDAFMLANSLSDYDERLFAIRDLTWKMPEPNFHLLRRLMEHLDKITEEEEVNAMHAANLSIIFAPTLLQPPPGPSSFALSMTNLGKAANIVKSLILQQNWIFGEEVAEEEPVVEAIEDAEEEDAASEFEILDEAMVGVSNEEAFEDAIDDADDASSVSDHAVVDFQPSRDSFFPLDIPGAPASDAGLPVLPPLSPIRIPYSSPHPSPL